jgi:hypothetical protein
MLKRGDDVFFLQCLKDVNGLRQYVVDWFSTSDGRQAVNDHLMNMLSDPSSAAVTFRLVHGSVGGMVKVLRAEEFALGVGCDLRPLTRSYSDKPTMHARIVLAQLWPSAYAHLMGRGCYQAAVRLARRFGDEDRMQCALTKLQAVYPGESAKALLEKIMEVVEMPLPVNG